MCFNVKLTKYIDIPLLSIIAIAALLRIAFLSNLPLCIDEASNAYDAYSIGETLKDQYGKFLPAFLKGIGGDARESLYILITVPFIKILGLNEFAARFPAALIGILTILITYALTKECFDRKTALLAALFLAISPWHIQFSRIAFRAITMPFLFCLGLLFFLKSFKKKNYLIFSAFIFALSLWTYAAARIFVLLFLTSIVIVFWKYLWINKQTTIVASYVFASIFIPLLIFWLSPEGMIRAKAVGTVSSPIHFIHNYLSYFSLKFLFIRGDEFLRHGPWKIGQLQYVEFITLPIGIFYLFRHKKKEKIILFLWLIFYPIPAALTAPVHALRSIIGSPLFSILSAYGACQIINLFKISKKISFLVVSFIAIASIAVYCKLYFIDYPKYSTGVWSSGMGEAIKYAENSQYPCVVLHRSKYNPIYILVLFYSKYSPQKYHLSPVDPDLDKNQYFDKYQIINLPELKKVDRSCLFILRPEEVKLISHENYKWKILHTVYDHKNSELYKLIKLNN